MLEDFKFVYEQYPIFVYLFVAINFVMVGHFINEVNYSLHKLQEKYWTEKWKFTLNSGQEDAIVDLDKSGVSMQTLARSRRAFVTCRIKQPFYKNIIILSCLMLRDKCRERKNAISNRFILVEVVTAILSVVIAVEYGVSFEALFTLILIRSLMRMVLVDYDHMLLPELITMPLLWLGLLLNEKGSFVSLESAVIGAALGIGSLYCLGWIYKALTEKSGMDYGDYKIFAVFGAWFGWQALPLLILWTSVVLLIIGLGLISLKGRVSDESNGFGPYLALAGWLTIFYGEHMRGVFF